MEEANRAQTGGEWREKEVDTMRAELCELKKEGEEKRTKLMHEGMKVADLDRELLQSKKEYKKE